MTVDSLIDKLEALKLHHSGRAWLPEDAVGQCIAIVRAAIGDASARKDEAACVSSPTIGGSPSEIRYATSEIMQAWHRIAEAMEFYATRTVYQFAYSADNIELGYMARNCVPDVKAVEAYLRSPEPVNTDANYWKTRYLLLEAKSKPVSLKDGAESVRQFFDLSLVGPDCGFKPEDVARIIADKWGLKHVD